MLLDRFILLLLATAAITAGQPRRIVSTAPSITEMLFAVGAGDRVVGVTTFCHYPPEALKITKIGTYLEPNLETILALKADLVVAENSPLHRDQFAALGLKTVRVQFETIADVYDSLKKVGTAVGQQARADALVAQIQRDLGDVQRRVAGRKQVPMMFIVGRTPNSLDGMVATGSAAYMNAVIETAGGRNVFRDAPMRYFKVSTEQVIARNPDVIFDMGDMADTKTVTEEHKKLVLKLWQSMPMLSAVQHARIHAVASDIYVVPGPRVVECARAFARMLHPGGVPLTAMYQLRGVGLRYGSRAALRDVSVEIPAGQMLIITGPNGAGKSTLLSILGGLRREYSGTCLFGERDTREWPRRKFAQQVAVVPQTLQIEFPFTAEQVVTMGRTPFCDGMFESPEDHAAVEHAMGITDTTQFRARDFRSLSGGERQRVVLASALAQTPRVLLLDEPTTFLDAEHQLALMRILSDLAAGGMLVVTVTHDLNIAAAYADHLLMLKDGALLAGGPPRDVVAPEIIRNVFSIDARIHVEADGRRWVLYGH